MAQLPPIRKFYIEDYKSQATWIGPFLLILNSFVESVVSSLNKNLTIADNSTGDIKTIRLSTVPTATAPATISWNKPIRPVAIMVGNCLLKSSGTFVLSTAIQVQWEMSQTSSAILITSVAGITPSGTSQYELTLVCIAG